MKRVVIALINKNDEFLIIKHKRKNMWLPPGGHVEVGESDKEALIREVLEETGLRITAEEKPFYVMKEDKEITPHYRCKIKGTEKIKLQKEEAEEYRWIGMKDLEKNDISKEIKEVIKKALEK